MAPFNPNVPDLPEKSYLGLSKPISAYEGDQSGKYRGEAAGASLKGSGVAAQAEGSLASGIGKLFGEVVTGADETIKSIIGDSIRKNVNDERGALPTQIQNQFKKNPSIFGDESDNGGEDVPETVQSSTEGLEAKGQALKSGAEGGKFPLSYYSMRLESGLKELRDRFPGHVDYIDRTGERISGENSANKAWQRMLAEYQANANSGQREWNKIQSEAKGWADKTAGGMSAYNKLINGGYGSDPASARANYYKDMAPEITRLGILHTQNLQQTADDKTDEASWKNGRTTAENFAYEEVHNLYKGIRITASNGADGDTAAQLRQILDKNVMAPEGAKLSEPEAVQKKFYGQQLEERAVQTFKEKMALPTNEVGRPDRNGKGPSIASRMGPEAGRQIEDIATRTIRPMFKQAYEDFTPARVTVATYHSALLEAKGAMFNNNVMSNDEVARTVYSTQFMEKYTPKYLQDMLNSYFKITDFANPLKLSFGNAMIEMHRPETDSKVTSMGQVVDRMVSNDPSKTVYKPEDYKTFNDVVRGITNPNNNDPQKLAIAYRAFFPQNKDYLQKFTAGADRSAVFDTLYNHDMSVEMYRLGKNRPEYWQNYKNSAHEEFGNGIMHQTIMDLSTVNDPNLKLSWNTVTHNWQVELGKLPTDKYNISPKKGPSDPDTAPTIERYQLVRNAIGRLNQHLNTLENIGKVDKDKEGDVGNYLLRTMAAVNPDIAKMPGVPGDMYRTILNAKKAEVTPPQKGSTSPQDAPPSRKTSAPIPTLRPVDNMTPTGLQPSPEMRNDIPHFTQAEDVKSLADWLNDPAQGKISSQLKLDRKTGKWVPYEPDTVVKGKTQDRVSK